jgi:protein-S-isoprenylcysteine O-methyltransferase Ste14
MPYGPVTADSGANIGEYGLLPLAAMTIAPRHLSRLTNGIGFTVFAVWAAVTLSKMPAVGFMLAPSFLMELAVAISFLIRDEPKAVTKTLRARVSAYGGSFFALAFLQIGQRSHPEWFTPQFTPFTPIAIVMWLGGTVFTAYAVWHLRYAFSIEPAARRLVTSGPYTFARHPVYTGYFAQYLGMLITVPSIPFALALTVWAAAMIDRMYLEEAVLRKAFPEYVDYKRRVGALFPRAARRARAATAQQPDVASV